MRNQQKAFYFIVMRGDFEPPEEFVNGGLKRDLDELATDYFREKFRISNNNQKKELIRKYGKLDVFRKATGRKR